MFACVVGGFSCLGPLARIDIACAHFQTFLFPSLSESGIVCLLRFCFLECTEGRELFVFSVSVSSNAYFTDVSMLSPLHVLAVCVARVWWIGCCICHIDTSYTEFTSTVLVYK